MPEYIDEVELVVTVSGGVGTENFVCTGKVSDVYIEPPGSSAYDWSIVNKNNVPRAGEVGVSGSRDVGCDGRPCLGSMTFSLANAADGTYYVSIFLVVAQVFKTI